MSNDPLFPPSSSPSSDPATSPAIELIRAKVARVFSVEPNAAQELAEVKTRPVLSKHQRFMQELGASGKSLAEIQTAWHHYYTTLGDAEKHEVWQEFYDANRHTPYQKLFQKQQPGQQREAAAIAAEAVALEAATDSQNLAPTPNQNGIVVADHAPAAPAKAPAYAQKLIGNKAATRVLKSKVVSKINGNGKLTMKHHLQTLGFGLATGFIVLVVFLFTFFNEYIIAPFIQPSRNVSSTPIILGATTVAADAPPSVTIPKINIQIPIDFTVASYDETIIENDLKSGVIHYPNTVLPGQNGNGAYFGHSSGNIFNNGKYKFAFTLLHDLTTGDLFYITYSGKTYAYRIFDREIVPPTDVGVVTDTKGKQATATLITCDPPGISTNRLVLWGEQISPNPSTNTAATTPTVQTQPTALVGNGPSMWSNFVDWVEFWN